MKRISESRVMTRREGSNVHIQIGRERLIASPEYALRLALELINVSQMGPEPGDRALYQPIGSKRPHIPVTVLAIRDTRTSGGETVRRAKIREGRGGWVNACRLVPEGEWPD